MRFKLLSLSLLSLFASLPFTSFAQCQEGHVAGENLIDNSGFCEGYHHFRSDYNFNRDANGATFIKPGSFATVTNPQYAMSLYPKCFDHTSNGGVMLVFNGSDSPNDNAWEQELDNLKTNTDYVFSFWATSLLKFSPAQLDVFINGKSQKKTFTLDSTLCEWNQYSMTWNSKNNTNVQLAIRNLNSECYGAHFALDDVSFTSCEPDDLLHELKEAKVGQVFRLDNIYFETNKYILKEESFVELDLLVEFLWTKKQVEIEIAGHTDNVGSMTYNQILSENRAKAVAEYLKERGISPSRFTSNGYGEERPEYDNSTSEGRQKNRRVEFKITKI
ncbi:OmpA family protein [Reichenbachiella carrageenanivorans]|uniref:OmpA family protein n=1 Tax=Reichenbachiella carrageenanivorans TaxID=2979869 RepID=A0ABY6D251_9BACT|nr:OmpA family protein [Reichenbachiella carrageenanivorans]UXX80236.1 OmpA family protein [Reichenbachiella carrageenanivorans]